VELEEVLHTEVEHMEEVLHMEVLHTEVDHMEEGCTKVPRKKLCFYPQQVEEGHTCVSGKKLKFRLEKLEVDHMKASMDTNDRDNGMVVDAQSKIVYGGS
jgi:hypothetical protein